MRHSIFAGAGYLLNDDRSSGGAVDEADMLGCKHCQRTIRKRLWADDPTYCPRCDAPVCGPCHARIDDHGCEPFIAKINRQLDAAYRQRQNARILGI
jgi:hypothetical protein